MAIPGNLKSGRKNCGTQTQDKPIPRSAFLADKKQASAASATPAGRVNHARTLAVNEEGEKEKAFRQSGAQGQTNRGKQLKRSEEKLSHFDGSTRLGCKTNFTVCFGGGEG